MRWKENLTFVKSSGVRKNINNIEIVRQQVLSFESMLNKEHCNKYIQ